MKGSDAPESFIMDFPNEFNTTHDISNCLKTIDQLGLIEDDIEEMNVMNRQELLDKSMRIYSDTYAK